MRVCLVAVLLGCAHAHVPFFVDKVGTIERPVDVSQAYYFKQSGKLTAPSHRLPDSTPVEIISRERTAACSVTIQCDNNAPLVTSMADADDAIGEPFTQSSYHRVIQIQSMTCTETFFIEGTCSSQWAAVVGTTEKFTARDLVMMPSAMAKIHGSWWNGHYMVGHIVPYGIIAVLSVVIATRATLTVECWLLAIALVVSGSWMIAKTYHTFSFMATNWGWGVAMVLLELWPISIIAWLWYDREVWAGVVGLVSALAMMFVLGAGFLWGPILIGIASVLHVTMSQQTDSSGAAYITVYKNPLFF